MTRDAQPSYPLFDWLRFALASGVALSHENVIRWPNAGNLSVQVFFALSGWLIGGILIKSGPDTMPHFYFNRVTRIWIPYFCAVAALYALSAIRHDPINFQWVRFLIYDVTFTHNWFSLWPDAKAALAQMPQQGTGNHFWSIAVEEQFYLLSPLIIYFAPLGRSPVLWAAIVLSFLALGLTDFCSVSLGVLAASTREHFDDWHLDPKAIAFIAICGVVAALLLNSFYQSAAPFFAVAVVLLTARHGDRGPIGKFLGGVSFPMYLNAWIGGYIVNGITRHVFPQLLPASALLTYAGGAGVGIIAYLLVDRNVMAQRRDWFSPKLGRTLMFCGYGLLMIGVAIFVFTEMPETAARQ